MCEPTLILGATIGLSLIGGAVAYSASKQATKFNDQIAKTNQKVAEAQAVDAERAGQLEANERRLKTRLMLGSQTVGFAAQNVDSSTGTALDILGDTAMFGEIDEQRIRANAQRKAWGFRMQGWDIGVKNQLQKFQGKVDRIGTILTTAGNITGAFGNYAAAGGTFGGGGGSSGGGVSGSGNFNYPQG